MKIAFQKKKKKVKYCWPIIGKEPFLRTGLSVVENIRNLDTLSCSGTMKVCQISCFFTVI